MPFSRCDFWSRGWTKDKPEPIPLLALKPGLSNFIFSKDLRTPTAHYGIQMRRDKAVVDKAQAGTCVMQGVGMHHCVSLAVLDLTALLEEQYSQELSFRLLYY